MTDTEIGYVVLDWWKDLTGMKKDSEGVLRKVDAGRTGERAELRRCKSPEQVITNSGFHELRSKLEDSHVNMEAIAAIAGLCSHIRNNDPAHKFPELLAIAKEGVSSPPLSENRFKKILTSRSSPEFYTGLRRAIQIIDNKGNIPSLVEGVILWYRHKKNPATNVQDTMLFKWSKAYYDVLLKKEKSSSK